MKINPDGATLRIVDEHRATPLIVQNAPSGGRPYLHPICSLKDGLTLTEDAPAHHPWQHGLYLGLNDVNGFGFWTEGRHPEHKLDGSFRTNPARPIDQSSGAAAWEVSTEYLAPSGERLLAETQRWRMQHRSSYYTLDLKWTLRAHCDVHFGKYPYGGLFLRMPWTPERPVWLLTDQGATDHASAEGRGARWVALSMKLSETAEPAGIAILSHPENPVSPMPWRVDGNYGINPARCIAGAWKLKANDAATEFYRLVVFDGRPAAGFLNSEYERYTKGAL